MFFFCQPNKKPIQATWAKSGSKANRPIPLEPEVLADLIKVPLAICGAQPYYHQTFQVPKMEVLTYISCMDTAYVRENPPPK